MDLCYRGAGSETLSNVVNNVRLKTIGGQLKTSKA